MRKQKNREEETQIIVKDSLNKTKEENQICIKNSRNKYVNESQIIKGNWGSNWEYH